MPSKSYDALIKFTGQVSKSFTSSIGGVNKSLSSIEKHAASVQRTLGGFERFVVCWTAGSILFRDMFEAAKGTVDAALEEQRQVATLNQLLKNNRVIQKEGVNAYAQQRDALLAQNMAMEKQGVIGHDVLLSGEATLARYQLTGRQINMLLPSMADMLAAQKGYNATQEDAVQNAKLLGKAIVTGELGPLKRAGVAFKGNQKTMQKEFKELTSTYQRIEWLTKHVEQNLGGVNAALLKTPGGKISFMEHSFKTLNETIGEKLLPGFAEIAKSLGDMAIAAGPVFKELATDAGRSLSSLGNWVQKTFVPWMKSEWKEATKTFGPELKGTLYFLKDDVDELEKGFKKLFGTIDVGSTAGRKQLNDSLLKGIKDLNKALIEVRDDTEQFFGWLKNASDWMDKLMGRDPNKKSKASTGVKLFDKLANPFRWKEGFSGKDFGIGPEGLFKEKKPDWHTDQRLAVGVPVPPKIWEESQQKQIKNTDAVKDNTDKTNAFKEKVILMSQAIEDATAQTILWSQSLMASQSMVPTGSVGGTGGGGGGSNQELTEYGRAVDYVDKSGKVHGTPDSDSTAGIGHIKGVQYNLNTPGPQPSAMKYEYATKHYGIKPGGAYISDKDHKPHRWMDTTGAVNPKNEDMYKHNALGGIVHSKTLSWLAERGAEAVIPLNRNKRSQKLLASAMARVGVGRGSGGGGETHYHHNPVYNITHSGQVADTDVERWVRKGHSDWGSYLKNWEHEIERRSFHTRQEEIG